MNSQTIGVVSLALLTVLLAFAVPSMISATDGPQTLETRLSPGTTDEVTDGLEITLDATTANETDVTLTDVETNRTQTLTISEGTTEPYSLPGGDGNVTAVETSADDATLNVSYSPTYGYGDAATTFVDNIGIMLILLVMLVVMGGLVVVIK